MSYAHETCCAHLKIQYCREFLDGLTHDWWECASCKMLFAPLGRASLPQWIPISERLPTSEDADEQERVTWKWADGTSCTGRFDDSGDEDDPAAAWLPLPPYTPPKPEPTDAECERFWRTRAVQATEREARYDALKMWFANVMARIEQERGQ